MADETTRWVNEWTVEAAKRGEGLGEGLGRAFLDHGAPNAAQSLLAAAFESGIPATVHLSVGTDINHQHPHFRSFSRGPLPVADRLGEEIVTLPLYSDITGEDVDTVISAVVDFDGMS